MDLSKFLYNLSDELNSEDPNYGINYSNNIFVIHKYCYCESPSCPYCWDFTVDIPTQEYIDKYGMEEDNDAPNFWYKPLDFKVWWYKTIHKGLKTNKLLSKKEFMDMQVNCFESIK